MAKKINGLTVAINADTSGVTAGLKDLTTQSIALSQQLKTVDKLLEMDPGNAEVVATRQKVLAESVETTKKKLEALKAAQKDVQAQFERGDIGTKEYVAFQNELVRTESRLKELGDTTEETADDMQDAEKKSGKFGETLQSVVAKGAKAAAAAIAAAGAASAKLVKDVVDKTGELEQNMGGSVSVFGDYAEQMQKAGEDAYKNMGVSQSEYLATANKMGALFQGTGMSAEQSADMTEKAMQRAADMASVMGIDMSQALESVAGAAKGNFTMMDNLGVAINDTTLKAYAQAHGLGELETTQDKVNAAMQMFLETTDKYDGNFAKEATETISGSLGLLSASWESLIAGLGNGEADIKKLSGNVVDAFEAVADNIEPVLDAIVDSLPDVLDSVINAVDRLLPKLLPSVIKIFDNVLTALMRSLPKLVPVASKALLTITDTLVKNLPSLIKAAMLLIATLAEGIVDALPELVPTIVDVALEIVDILTDPNTLSTLIDASIAIIMALTEGIIDSLPKLAERLPEIVENIVDGIIDALPKLLDAAEELVKKLGEYLFDSENADKMLTAGMDIITKIAKGIGDAIYKIGLKCKEIVKEIADKIGLGEYWEIGQQVIDEFMDGVVEKWNEWSSWWQGFGEYIYDMLHPGSDDGSMINEADVWTPPEEPGAATGAYITRPTRLLTGEGGRKEVVLPLEQNTGWADILADKIAAAGGGGGVQIANLTINAGTGTDGRQLANDFISQLDTRLRQMQIQQVRGIGGTAW